MSDVRINTRSPYYIEANPTAPEVPDTPEIPDPPTNIPPTVTITASNENPFVGETVTLTAVATDSDGTIVSYLWGGTSSPQTSVSIDVTSTEVQSKVFNVAVTDDDGDVGIAQITINWQEIPEQIINTDIDVECGDVINEGVFTGTKTYNLIGVGDKIGDVEIELLTVGYNQDSPVRFDISWNGATTSTGYIGNSTYPVAGTIPSPNNTADPTTKSDLTSLTIFKSAATPTQVTLTATPFEQNDAFSFRLNCPSVTATETFFHTLTGTCTSGDTTFTYTDVNGDAQTVILANGAFQQVSAQDGTVVTAVCSGTVVKGGQSFDLGTPELDIEVTTEFDLFETSGAGNVYQTNSKLQQAFDGKLKEDFLQFYNDDEVQYQDKVNLISVDTSTGYIDTDKNPSRWLSFAASPKRDADSTKNVNVVLINSGQYVYHFGNTKADINDYAERGIHYDTDLATFRSQLDAAQNYGDTIVMFLCIEAYADDWNALPDSGFATPYVAFTGFLDNISLGTNGYEGDKGLSDRSEVIFVRNVIVNQSPDYYANLIKTELSNIGFQI